MDRTAQLWFSEAVELIRLRRQGREQEAIRRINQGLSEGRFNAFRAEHTRLLEEIERVRVDALAGNDRRGLLTFAAICVAALLTLIVVVVVSRQLWRRVGGPVALLSEGVGRVTRGRLSDPIPPSRDAVRELAELMEGFNLMQREVQGERDAVAAAARREAAQRTERQLWETVQNGLLPERLPSVRGLRLAARYQPAERALLVGGDFYDADMLPDGRLAVMVGDMAGHGAPAAAQAAGLRFGWRTLVSVNPNPAAVLAALNAQMAQPAQRAEGLFASIIYMLIDPRGSVSFAAAGHPMPFFLTATVCQPLEPHHHRPPAGGVRRGGVAGDPRLAAAGRDDRALHRRADRGAPRRGHLRHRAGLRRPGGRADLGRRAARRAPHRRRPPPRGPEPARRRGGGGDRAAGADLLGRPRGPARSAGGEPLPGRRSRRRRAVADEAHPVTAVVGGVGRARAEGTAAHQHRVLGP